ncbi:flagellar biosynthesis anti-sigma factor FlgM [Gallaecimonas xiamenensis]|uniref:Lateral flagella anti-sigma-28 factor, LfgM n=1 Tax=Gallaecimonas xiamenensis 3-C-1 TaxID=745411 RepID=K2IUI6_9GAMM|nr:flagellar biosynthesis anti-sigma factor FlgM [Gallaecimonas xiamenensis]EKE73971.1 lateral flagella anti-sigma-28 factor, LfgM [Gallaecimonas xiamenensis 3-C-1]
MKIHSSSNVYQLVDRPRGEAFKAQVDDAPRVTSDPAIGNTDLAGVLAGTSDVDVAKVNEVRQALLEGRLTLDPEQLAEDILAMHRS